MKGVFYLSDDLKILFSSRHLCNSINSNIDEVIQAVRNIKEIDDKLEKLLYEAFAVSVIRQIQNRNLSACSTLSNGIHQIKHVLENKNENLSIKISVLEDMIDEHIDSMIHGFIEP